MQRVGSNQYILKDLVCEAIDNLYAIAHVDKDAIFLIKIVGAVGRNEQI